MKYGVFLAYVEIQLVKNIEKNKLKIIEIDLKSKKDCFIKVLQK
jgi:hypothetical protein